MAAVLGTLLTLVGLLVMVGAAVVAGTAAADTAPYELYCPGTPVGSVVINDVVTSGTLTPAPGGAGSTFDLTNYQTAVPLPQSLATAAAALQPDLTGSASTAVDAVGASPASTQEGPFNFDVPIPSPVPASGLTLDIPASPVTLGPFTVTGSTVTLSQDSTASLTLVVSGTPLSLSCTAYPNDDVTPSGIAPTDAFGNPVAPTGSPISPVIATASTSGTTTTTVAGSTTTTTTGSGGEALTGPYELYCPGTPVGNVALNGVTTGAVLDPATPTVGQTFSVSQYQTSVTIPAAIVIAAQALGNSVISGAAQTELKTVGATPAGLAEGPFSFSVPIPSTVPTAGLAISVPAAASTVGPFTATASSVTIEEASAVTLSLLVTGNTLTLDCTSYADNSVPTGIATSLPAGPPIDPVIAVANAAGGGGGGGGGGGNGVSAPYELYCPNTPVGDLDFNGVTSSGTFSTSSLSAGGQFQVNGYQISIPVPEGVAAAAQGLSNASFAGLGASALDAYGASPSLVPTGSLTFAVPIPDPVPATGITLNMPDSPTTVGPFTADGGPVAIAQDQRVLVVAKLSGKAFTMNCTAFPNDSIATSGSTTTAPAAEPIRPLIVQGTASGSSSGPPPPPPPNPGPGSPYELYCSPSPIGDLAVNDVVTTATISPSNLNEGDTFQVTGLQTTFTIPQGVAQEMENLGLTTLSGDLSAFLEVSGTQYGGYPYPVYTTIGPGLGTIVSGTGSSGVGVPFPFPGYGDMPFSVTLPSPVPAGGVEITANSQGGYYGSYVASGGPISVSLFGSSLFVNAFGDEFGMFCQPLANDSVPTGISTVEPVQDIVQPVIATATATNIPPPPGPPGAYELYCPGTPIGTVVLNGASTTGTISPADPASGTQFALTGYQTQVTIPAAIVSAAAALGNADIMGSASTTLEATGATPASLASPTMSFDVTIPTPVPPAGLTLSVPSTPASVGPFTATGGDVTIDQSGRISLTLVVAGNDLTLNCDSYPDNSLPSGIDAGNVPPPGGPISPQIATTASSTPTTAPGSTPTTADPTTSQSDPGTQPTTPQPTTGSGGGATTGGSGGGGGTGGSGGGTGGSGGGGSGGSGGGGSGAVTAPSSALAFTGSGPAVRVMALVGALTLLLGLGLLVAAEEPKTLLRLLLRRLGR